MSKNLLINGTKKIIQQKTTGQAIINLSNHFNIKFTSNPIFKKTINPETKVLVQNDIIVAKMNKRVIFIN